MINQMVIHRPDDWHVHLRDGAMPNAVAGCTARQFAPAIVTQNLTRPIVTVAADQSWPFRSAAINVCFWQNLPGGTLKRSVSKATVR